MAPLARLVEEAAKGGPLPDDAPRTTGSPTPAGSAAERWWPCSATATRCRSPTSGAPVTVRVHRERIVIWRDAERLAEHARAPDGAHRRVVDPAHFAPLFGRKPRAQVMLYREALLELGPVAASYVGELSRRQRARLGDGDPGGCMRCTSATAQASCWPPWRWPRRRAPTGPPTCRR